MKKMFNFLAGLLIILAVLYFCDFILKSLKINFPAPILGIIVLFILLKTDIIKENLVKDFCEFILKYMILFFIPAVVGIMNYFDILSDNLAPILMTIFITTALVIVVVGLFTYNAIKFQRLLRLKKGIKKWFSLVF